jgi:hypothetical protein
VLTVTMVGRLTVDTTFTSISDAVNQILQAAKAVGAREELSVG